MLVRDGGTAEWKQERGRGWRSSEGVWKEEDSAASAEEGARRSDAKRGCVTDRETRAGTTKAVNLVHSEDHWRTRSCYRQGENCWRGDKRGRASSRRSRFRVGRSRSSDVIGAYTGPHVLDRVFARVVQVPGCGRASVCILIEKEGRKRSKVKRGTQSHRVHQNGVAKVGSLSLAMMEASEFALDQKSKIDRMVRRITSTQSVNKNGRSAAGNLACCCSVKVASPTPSARVPTRDAV
ncbi:hypothetical protein V8E36_001626 [Tilletia maclaganii]